jgi:hypothetical protein
VEIYAVVGAAERPLLGAAARLLAECLEAATGTPKAVGLTFADAIRSDFLRPDGPDVPEECQRRQLVPAECRHYRGSLYQGGQRIVVLSLRADVLQPALRHGQKGYPLLPLPDWQEGWTPSQREWVAVQFEEAPPVAVDTAARHWEAICTEVLRGGATGVFLCNVFRHVAGPVAHRYNDTAESLGERIRKFNLLAADVSHTTGAFVVDLDRALTRVGARALGTDYLLGGEAAAAAGAEALVSTLFRAGLDDYLPPEVEAKALAAFEARQAADDWLASHVYQNRVMAFFAHLQALRSGSKADVEGVRRFGTFLLRAADELQGACPARDLSLHRQFLAAVREFGAGQLDMIRAVQARDAAALRRAEARAWAGSQQLGVFGKAFDEFCKRSGRRTG